MLPSEPVKSSALTSAHDGSEHTESCQTESVGFSTVKLHLCGCHTVSADQSSSGSE